MMTIQAQGLQDPSIVVNRGKFVALNACIKTQGRLKTQEARIQLKVLLEKQAKPPKAQKE